MSDSEWKEKYEELKAEYEEFIASSADLEKGLEEELKDVEKERNGYKSECAKMRSTIIDQSEEIDRLKEQLQQQNLKIATLEQDVEDLEIKVRRHDAVLDEQKSFSESTLEIKLQQDHDLERYSDFLVQLKTMTRSAKTQLNPDF